MKHILLEKSFRYRKRGEIRPPIGFIYNKRFGAWLSILDGSLLVVHKQFPAVATKKQDIETGEDQKGQ